MTRTRTVQPPARRSPRRRALFSFLAALGLLWALGQLLRDRTWLTGLCFYIPSPLLALALLMGALTSVARRRWRAGALVACLALPPLAVVLVAENHLFVGRAATAPGQLRLVHWNVGGALGRPDTRDVLLAQRADLYVLSEVPDAGSVERLREALGPAYQAQVFGNLAVVGAGTVRADGWLLDRGRTKVQAVTWEHAGARAVLFVVDLPSAVHVARNPVLREVNALVARHRPDLVIGDFNAPRRSRALADLPPGYGHAYDAVGSGFGYTWPVPVPVYALDHCLYGPRVVPARYELASSRLSDHRLQVFEFSWSPGE